MVGSSVFWFIIVQLDFGVFVKRLGHILLLCYLVDFLISILIVMLGFNCVYFLR